MSNEIMKNDNAMSADFDVPTFINTLDLSTNKGKMETVNAMNNSEPLAQHMEQELFIRDCITIPGVRKGRNGMPDTKCVNTYLIDTDGNSYFSQSDGVNRSAQMFATLWPDFGKATTDEGYLTVKCVEQELPNGNTLKALVIVE